MNIKYIRPFICSTTNAVSRLTGKSIQPQNPYLYDRKNTHTREVSGIIGLAGDIVGMVVISMTTLVAQKLVVSILGLKTYDEVDDETLYDAVGEFANIITGNAKRDLEEFNIAISLPSIVIGLSHKIGWLSSVPVVIVPFSSEIGKISLYICMNQVLE